MKSYSPHWFLKLLMLASFLQPHSVGLCHILYLIRFFKSQPAFHPVIWFPKPFLLKKKITPRYTFVLKRSMSFDKWIMPCSHHYSIIQYTFAPQLWAGFLLESRMQSAGPNHIPLMHGLFFCLKPVSFQTATYTIAFPSFRSLDSELS